MTEVVKPFKILATRIEDDGETGVVYAVQKASFVKKGKTDIKKLEGYMSVPIGEDVDQFVFNELSKVGWF
jgi:hypothetical protein